MISDYLMKLKYKSIQEFLKNSKSGDGSYIHPFIQYSECAAEKTGKLVRIPTMIPL